MTLAVYNEKGMLGIKHINEKDALKMYVDWVNNFITVEKFAEYYNLSYYSANSLINWGRKQES